MRKLKLDVDRLEVESFRTASGTEVEGTVHAHYTLAAQGCTTDDDSCRGTCGGNTCWDTDSCLGCDTYYCPSTYPNDGSQVNPCTYDVNCTQGCTPVGFC